MSYGSVLASLLPKGSPSGENTDSSFLPAPELWFCGPLMRRGKGRRGRLRGEKEGGAESRCSSLASQLVKGPFPMS